MSNTQIQVGSTKVSIFSSLLRYGLTAVGGVLVGKGWVTEEQATDLVGAALVVIPTVWGVIKSRKNNEEKKRMANALHDAIAIVK